jgi:hypothetical protein
LNFRFQSTGKGDFFEIESHRVEKITKNTNKMPDSVFGGINRGVEAFLWITETK